MILGEIYKRDFQGRLRVWYAEVSPDGTQYRTVSGLYDGARTTSEWTQCRANAQRATAQAQCEFEVDALYRHRLARTYHQTIEATEGGAHFFEPMLAHPLDRKRMGEPHIYIQPKLDGARCIATADGLFTRQGKEFLSAPHISRALKPYFELHPDAILDGELYGDKMAVDFQRIMSLARKTKNITDADLRESERLLQLHLYDMPSRGHDTYAARYAGICEAARIVSAHAPEWGDSPIRVVETFAITTWEQWDKCHEKWVAGGFEGSMGRTPTAPYQNKRTHDLVKRKDFIDNEFQVAKLGEGEGNWAGACKRIWCWLPVVPEHERTPDNISEETTFIAVPRGSREYLTKLLHGPVPKEITCRYFEWTTSTIPKPRFPIGVAIWPDGRDV